jgi:hypothetical protein
VEYANRRIGSRRLKAQSAFAAGWADAQRR